MHVWAPYGKEPASTAGRVEFGSSKRGSPRPAYPDQWNRCASDRPQGAPSIQNPMARPAAVRRPDPLHHSPPSAASPDSPTATSRLALPLTSKRRPSAATSLPRHSPQVPDRLLQRDVGNTHKHALLHVSELGKLLQRHIPAHMGCRPRGGWCRVVTCCALVLLLSSILAHVQAALPPRPLQVQPVDAGSQRRADAER